MHFHGSLFRDGVGKNLATPGAKDRGIDDRVRLRFAGGRESGGEGTPLELQPIAAVPRIEVIVCRVRTGEAELLLDAMPHFVGEERGATIWFARQREHDHRPFHSSPAHRGVGNVHTRRELADIDAVLLLELVFGVGLVREDFTRGGIHEQERPAKRFSPKCARVLFAERPCFSDVASNLVNLRAALLVRSDTSGEKCDPKE